MVVVCRPFLLLHSRYSRCVINYSSHSGSSLQFVAHYRVYESMENRNSTHLQWSNPWNGWRVVKQCFKTWAATKVSISELLLHCCPFCFFFYKTHSGDRFPLRESARNNNHITRRNKWFLPFYQNYKRFLINNKKTTIKITINDRKHKIIEKNALNYTTNIDLKKKKLSNIALDNHTSKHIYHSTDWFIYYSCFKNAENHHQNSIIRWTHCIVYQM